MNWISYDDWKIMKKFYEEKELEFKNKYGFSHNKCDGYFKIEYVSTVGNRRIVHYSINGDDK